MEAALREHIESKGLGPLLEQVRGLGAACVEDLSWLDAADFQVDAAQRKALQPVLEDAKRRFPRSEVSTVCSIQQAWHVKPLVLLELAKAGDVVGLRKILHQRMVNVDVEEEGSGVTALCVAADGGKFVVSRTLIKSGANVNHA